MKDHILVNSDTDSIMITKADQSPWTEVEKKRFLEELNKQFPEMISWEDDGVYSRVIVIGSKNYALLPEDEKKIKLKGSAIRDQKKEPALREMIESIINALIEGRYDDVNVIYEKYISEALNTKDIKRWCQKKTVTKSVLECKGYTPEDIKNKKFRKNEADVWDAIAHKEGIQEGDKIWCYPIILGEEIIPGGVSKKTGKPLKDKKKEITGLRLIEHWNNDHDHLKLVDRVYATLNLFKLVMDMDKFVNYTLKKNHSLLLDGFCESKTQ